MWAPRVPFHMRKCFQSQCKVPQTPRPNANIKRDGWDSNGQLALVLRLSRGPVLGPWKAAVAESRGWTSPRTSCPYAQGIPPREELGLLLHQLQLGSLDSLSFLQVLSPNLRVGDELHLLHREPASLAIRQSHALQPA